ncbi:MAG: 4-hydroxy-3-methylbut-2-enyl diphosphate reductase [Epulopiscium sp. Nele67-Bin004]|nr:MAG: 4-hydroxy-3-methylbut-2-enyl diphosphate reductase [Epulopiscium sp. Nele67-Bin004]
MEIIVAKSAGFCFGVQRAVDMAYKTAGQKNTFTLGPLIHNDAVIEDLRNRGIGLVDNIEDSVESLIIRSHGVTPQIYNKATEQNINIIDATCPYVKKIHMLVERNFKKGYTIIIVGDASHPEIIGINGWGNDQCLIIKDANELCLDKDKAYFVVAQTTYKQEVVDNVIEYLTEHNYNFKYVPTICDATTNRQTEARQIAKVVDIMIVIGSRYSSNTQKLYEVCAQVCNNAICIENTNSLPKINFDLIKKVGITAGASTPKHIIEDVINQINMKG